MNANFITEIISVLVQKAISGVCVPGLNVDLHPGNGVSGDYRKWTLCVHVVCS